MNENYLKVEGYSNLVRDPNTNAIINTDTKSYNYYVNARNSKRQELNRIDKIEFLWISGRQLHARVRQAGT